MVACLLRSSVDGLRLPSSGMTAQGDLTAPSHINEAAVALTQTTYLAGCWVALDVGGSSLLSLR